MNAERIRQGGRSVENLLAFFSIFLLALFPFLEVIARTVFSHRHPRLDRNHPSAGADPGIHRRGHHRQGKPPSLPGAQPEVPSRDPGPDPGRQRPHQHGVLHGFRLVFPVVPPERVRPRRKARFYPRALDRRGHAARLCADGLSLHAAGAGQGVEPGHRGGWACCSAPCWPGERSSISPRSFCRGGEDFSMR